MSFYENRLELACKADYEGGLDELFLGYGLERADLPQDDEELLAAFDEVEKYRQNFSLALDAMQELLPEPNEELLNG